MIIAIGQIVDTKGSLIGVRIYDINKKSIKDISIEDTNKIKIKNKSKIYRLGIVDNKNENSPLILLGYKDRKAIVIDINGRTKIIEDISKYEVVNIKSNVEEYNDYINRVKIIGKETFRYRIKEDTDEVIVTNYIESAEDYKVIEIPSFVTGVEKIEYGNFGGIFQQVNQSLKVIHRHNQIKDMSNLFEQFKGKKLDLINFDTSRATNMKLMFTGCNKLEKLDLRSFDTSTVTNMKAMLDRCCNLKKLDLKNFDTSKVTDMSAMFDRCYQLKELDIRNFNTSNVTDMNYMFAYCKEIKELDLRNFDTSKVTDMSWMFSNCYNLEELDLRNFDTSNIKTVFSMFRHCENLKELDLRNFDTSNVEDMHWMFSRCKNLKELALSNFDTSNVTDKN